MYQNDESHSQIDALSVMCKEDNVLSLDSSLMHFLAVHLLYMRLSPI